MPRTQDVGRDEEWCRVEAICPNRDLVPQSNVCRIQYAFIQVSGGFWTETDNELTEAIGRLAASPRASGLRRSSGSANYTALPTIDLCLGVGEVIQQSQIETLLTGGSAR